MNAQISQSAAVRYQVSIHDAETGRAVKRLPAKRNLILDQGLDGIAVRSWANAFRAAAIGTGTIPTKRDSGAVTVSRTGATLTSSAGFFEAADVGRLFKFDTGEEVRITAFTNSTTVTTSTSGAIAASEGTVWYVNQTALAVESKRTDVYSNDGGANGTTYSSPTVTQKRTFIFSAESSTITYREIGWSHTTTPGPNLFGRDLLAGAGVTLVSGQQLRVVVELAVSYAPVTPIAYTSIATGGWTANGTCGIESLFDILDINWGNTVRPSGMDIATSPSLDPSGTGRILLASDSVAVIPASLAQRVVPGLIHEAVPSLGAYIAGSFIRTKSIGMSTLEANSSAIRSIVLGGNGTGGGRTSSFRVRLDAAEAKTSSQTLTIGFTLSWGRSLVN